VGYIDSWTQRYRSIDLGPHALLLPRLLVRRRAAHLTVGIAVAVLLARSVLYLAGVTSLGWMIGFTVLVVLAAGIGLVVRRLGDSRVAETVGEPPLRLESTTFADVVGRRTAALLTVSYGGAVLLGLAALVEGDDVGTVVVFLIGVALLGLVTFSALRDAVERPVIAVDHGSMQANDLLRVNDAKHAAVAYPALLALATMTSSGWLLTVFTGISVVTSVVALAHEPLTAKVPVAR
jgi:hypothetical protein